MTPSFQFEPFPHGLYTAQSLLAGFDPDRPGTYGKMKDTLIYREFVQDGGAACGDYLTAMSRALHDNGITQALADAIDDSKVVAIMGGHGGSRRDASYADTARLASRLAKDGFVIATGGGPGTMEAAHLGAAFAGDTHLNDALALLSAESTPPKIPGDAGKLVNPDGSVVPTIAENLGRYLAPAVRILRELGHGGGLGIPTWLYGHEPTTPLAASIAKYFQNSIREDGLLALATHGVMYMEGSAGTLQEVFQDTAQNYYHTFPDGPGKKGEFSPMVFYGEFWTKTMPIKPALDALFASASTPKNVKQEYQRWIKFTSDPGEAIAHIASFPGQAPLKLRARMGLKPPTGLD